MWRSGGAAGPGMGGAGGGGGGAGGNSGGGTPTVLASGEVGAWAIAVDGTSVYWTNQDSRRVMKVAVGGGTPVMLATGASAAQVPWDVTVDADAVYWSTYNSPGTVMRAPLAGGTPATLAQGQNGPRNIAVFGASAYWINSGSSAATRARC